MYLHACQCNWYDQICTCMFFIWNLATPDIEGFFNIEAFNIEGFSNIEYTALDIRYLNSISKTGMLAMYPKKSAIWPVHSFPETANKNQITLLLF